MKMLIRAHFWVVFEIFSNKLGDDDLFFGVPPGFISRSVRARLQVSVFSGNDSCPLGLPRIGFYILTLVTLKSRSNLK